MHRLESDTQVVVVVVVVAAVVAAFAAAVAAVVVVVFYDKRKQTALDDDGRFHIDSHTQQRLATDDESIAACPWKKKNSRFHLDPITTTITKCS